MKMVKNIKKIIISIIIVLICISSFNFVYAADDTPSLGDIFTYAHEFESAASAKTELVDSSNLNSSVISIYDILITVAIAIAFLVGALLGIQYISGTVEDKAKIKKTLFASLIGCVVVFGAFGIWKLALNILQ